MTGLRIPQLQRKLDLLVSYARLSGRDAVAAHLNRSTVTIRGWINGNSGTPPETVPAANIPALLALFHAALPGASEAESRALLLGPADELERRFRSPAPVSLHDLVAAEAVTDRGTLFTEDGSLSIVRIRTEPQGAAAYHLRLGQFFRIEFRAHSRAGHITALQATPSGWAFVPASCAAGSDIIHLPGPGDDGETGWMVEDTDPGRHRFIALHTARPIFGAIAGAARDGGYLDHALIAHLAHIYREQPDDARRIYALSVDLKR